MSLQLAMLGGFVCVAPVCILDQKTDNISARVIEPGMILFEGIPAIRGYRNIYLNN
jgi:hypothetical protein